MKKILIAITLLLVVFTASVSGQAKKINIIGKVISFEESFPLEGVSVVVKGTKNITGTQADGTFTLTLLPEDILLVVSYDGYETQEVKISSARDYEIVLRRKNDVSDKQALKDITTRGK